MPLVRAFGFSPKSGFFPPFLFLWIDSHPPGLKLKICPSDVIAAPRTFVMSINWCKIFSPDFFLLRSTFDAPPLKYVSLAAANI